VPPWLAQEPAQLKLMEAASASALSEDQKRAHEMLKVRSRTVAAAWTSACTTAARERRFLLFGHSSRRALCALWLKVLILSERLATQPRARHALGELFLAVRQSAR
jgi:hypothetical protein